MTFVSFIFIILITVGINVFVTAFIVARSSQSNKIIQELKNGAEDIIRRVNRATNTHITIAENTVEDIKTLIEEARKSSDVLLRRIKNQPTQKSASSKKQKGKEDNKVSNVRRKKTNPTKKTHAVALVQNKQFLELVKKKYDDEHIALELGLTKAEVTLTRFLSENKNSQAKKK